MKYQGIIHNHSACSKEGCYPLEVLRQRWMSHLDFAAMTEHAERTTAEGFASYLQECEALSDERFRFIPGLEVATEAGDMLLLGCRKYICTRDPYQVLREATGSVILLAHPEEGKMLLDVLGQADGFECWNGGHMGGFMPPLDWFPGWKQWRSAGRIVTGGNDIHKVDPKRKILTVIQSPSRSENDILNAIKQGHFITTNGIFSLTPDGHVSFGKRDVTKNLAFAALARGYRLFWRGVNSCLEFGAVILATIGVDKQKRTKLNRLLRQHF